MDNKILDTISKVIAICTSLLIFLGIISSVVYYRAFSINILDNITIGETLILFVSNFASLTIVTIFGVVLSLFFPRLNDKVEASEESETKLPQKLTFNIRQQLFVFTVITPLFLLSVFGFSPLAFWTLPVSFIVRTFVLIYITRKLRLVFQNRNIEIKYVDYLIIAGMSIILTATIAMTQAYLVYNRLTDKVTLYSLKGEVIRTDSNTLYLGKSQSFYYLYNKKNDQAIILKADQINRIEVKKNNGILK